MTNGKTDLTVEDLDLRALVEVLIEATKQLAESVEELKEINVEILEKVNNLSTEGDGFHYDS